uniref:Uncharacterized protein n=1 Tax=Apteryx owenii TaxID=8824 RepID=A0A8B9QBB9_APTOW
DKRKRGEKTPYLQSKKKLLEELGESRLPYMTLGDAGFHQLVMYFSFNYTCFKLNFLFLFNNKFFFEETL